jgi:hypothetical protein
VPGIPLTDGGQPAWGGILAVIAIIFIMLVSCIAPFFGKTVLGWIVDMSALGVAIGYGYTSAAAFVHARRSGDAGIIATGVVGLIFAALFMVLLLVPIPSFNSSLGTESSICLAVWVVLGYIFYFRK